MDIDVSGWILEFLLRQNSVDDRSLNDLIRVLPLPNNNPRLKKSLLLRKIESDIEKGTISERTFEFLEQIEELDVKEGEAEVSEAMKAAYCTVAMHCTVKFIEESAGDSKEEYASTVRRIWGGRIREMERSEVAERVGLVQDDLLLWMNDIEAGVLDADACENVLTMVKGLDVLEVLRGYVNEAKEKMGPSFLELACETILNDDALSKTMGLDEGAELNNQIKDDAPTVAPAITQNVDANADNNVKGNEALREPVLPRHKHVATRCSRGSGRETHRGAKIVDPMETFRNRYDSIPTPQVKKVQKDLKTSSFELRAVVQDPLLDALRYAESFKASTSGENMAQDHVVGNSNRINVEAPSSSNDRNCKASEANGDDGFCRDQNKRPKPSLMERNSTAHTLEWSDSIDSSSKDGSPARPHLPSPKKRAVSPLRIYKMEKLARKRKKKRWTTIEEDTLRTGILKYGKGNWKLILSTYRDIFEDRTEVDLKDKWRNLMR
ncbi:uncharacterized protein LOC112518217 isoform X1 [Cynara cardunculus var. scolymus]|uniref:Homeodomain-like protein n=1 Tax=Cynara cardunculus var. scolymus TaxID=59895 RepID=A0A103XNP9_CYNCS|nr:uncharacterized protein LOC112518217 isoform X1 [Cynara cardunculus var. scolymus]KVH94146.1 Homeodomain-like protein [Cynara cardunculus var. scolymus]